ncbi:MAG: hypothetical protein WBE26_01240 [Phycisphaerae bacterium]
MKRCSGKPLVVIACTLVGVMAGGAAAQEDGSTGSGECREDVAGLQVTDVELTGKILNAGGNVVDGVIVSRLCFPNLRVASVLNRLDIDGDGDSDFSPDTDGDGLPDNWELGGVETSDVVNDRVVFYPAPSAIVPGTPPTPIFTRRAVATSALLADTDGDGLSDFIEVFGLMFIDDNHDGVLDANEWNDLNEDGLPSPGEYPVDQSDSADYSGFKLWHDFDGFVFTDPTNPDTDGDGSADGDDKDPLINPRSFGLSDEFVIRFDVDDDDIDNDGLGNGMDMGNDLLPDEATGLRQFQVIDNPENIRLMLDLFREDLLAEGVVPESTIEDLIGADWDGNGLWRTTDVREWSLVIDDPEYAATQPPAEYFRLVPDDPDTNLYYSQTFDQLTKLFNDDEHYDRYGDPGIGLGWQEILKPSSKDEFMPDARIWAILYAWRVPGFDIDGDGFIGVPNLPNVADFNGRLIALEPDAGMSPFRLVMLETLEVEPQHRPFDDRIAIGEPEPVRPELNGIIEVPGLTQAFRNFGCGAMSLGMLMAIALGLAWPRFRRRHNGGGAG